MRIKDAEADASKVIAKAEKEAQAIVADARRKTETMMEKARKDGDASRQAKMEAARQKADEAVAKALVEGRKDSVTFTSRFDAGVNGATGRVLKIFEERL